MIFIGMMVLVLSMFLVQGESYPYGAPEGFHCVALYCPNADQSLCKCTQFKPNPDNPNCVKRGDEIICSAVSIASNLDTSAGTSVTTLTGATGVTEDEIASLLDTKISWDGGANDYNIHKEIVIGDTGADDLYSTILGKRYEVEITSCQNQIRDLNQSLNEEKNKTLILEGELTQNKKYIEELKLNFTIEINKFQEKGLSRITGFFIRMFD